MNLVQRIRSIFGYGNQPPVADELGEDSELIRLAWAAIDGAADPESLEELDQLLASDDQAREAYDSVLALDRDLHALFSAPQDNPHSQLPG